VKNLVVTVDGPAGSGKTVCGRLAARELGIAFLSSGICFRAVTYHALAESVPLSDEVALAALASRLADSLGGEEPTDALKAPEVTAQVKYVAESPPVRAVLACMMRARAEKEPLLAEGRDMGSVVFRDAAVKLFLEADLACRVERRRAELLRLGRTVDEDELAREIAARDHRDRTRPVSPLVVPDGARVLDTSRLAIEEVVGWIVRSVRDG
jgi:cytidylate kinase